MNKDSLTKFQNALCLALASGQYSKAKYILSDYEASNVVLNTPYTTLYDIYTIADGRQTYKQVFTLQSMQGVTNVDGLKVALCYVMPSDAEISVTGNGSNSSSYTTCNMIIIANQYFSGFTIKGHFEYYYDPGDTTIGALGSYVPICDEATGLYFFYCTNPHPYFYSGFALPIQISTPIPRTRPDDISKFLLQLKRYWDSLG